MRMLKAGVSEAGMMMTSEGWMLSLAGLTDAIRCIHYL